ncbi:LacI family DNA-binding transcriptional regulator [Paenibacillus sp. 598K]|uniref:LacI family DNA-binding transcriptional regulator n=1 Tax=Paenibacillus sp. 598K TaxID=1117987 RepID=UPI000FFE93A6|nr:LacI family DNA-binding transcriptional regulator [Paenibacillus sp. 598K]
MITIKEIAKLAGCSFSTVSKALNDSPLVKEETKRKVLRIAEQYGYRRNLLARQLVSGKSGMIGLIWQDVDNPLYAQLAMRLFQMFQRHGYETVMMMSPPEQAADWFRQMRVDGLIFWGDVEAHALQLSKRLALLDTPLLVVGSNTHLPVHALQIDRKAGIYAAVEHLHALGHRRIGYIGDGKPVKERGYREALLDFGLRLHPGDVLEGGMSWEEGYEAIRRLDAADGLATAYIGGNNLVTRGALRAFAERGIAVPAEVSLIGYDELPEMAYAEVPLTSVGPPLEEVAERTVEMMLTMVRQDGEPQSRTIKPVLHIRSSTARPPS